MWYLFSYRGGGSIHCIVKYKGKSLLYCENIINEYCKKKKCRLAMDGSMMFLAISGINSIIKYFIIKESNKYSKACCHV